jgi:hypothetical protein
MLDTDPDEMNADLQPCYAVLSNQQGLGSTLNDRQQVGSRNQMTEDTEAKMNDSKGIDRDYPIGK